MQRFIRRYFWIVNLLVLLLGAYLSARTVNSVLASYFVPAPAFASDLSPDPAPNASGAPSINALARLFGVEADTKPEAETPAAVTDDGEPAATPLPLRVVGTLLSNLPHWSLAAIEDVTTREVAIYMPGDELRGGGHVLAVERLRVIIVRDGRREAIGLVASERGVAGFPRAGGATPEATGASAGAAEVRKVGDNAFEVARSDVERIISDPTALTGVRVIPAFKDGNATGFKLFSIRPESVFAKIGLQNGDVVRRINGLEVSSAERALEAYTQLRQATRVEVEVERGGKVVRQRYDVR